MADLSFEEYNFKSTVIMNFNSFLYTSLLDVRDKQRSRNKDGGTKELDNHM